VRLIWPPDEEQGWLIREPCRAAKGDNSSSFYTDDLDVDGEDEALNLTISVETAERLERYRDSEALIEHAANLGGYRGGNPCDGIGLQRVSLVSRAQSSERSWLTARSVSLRPSCQCRHNWPAWARLRIPRQVASRRAVCSARPPGPDSQPNGLNTIR
jgi:hypothetical protein